MVEVGKSGLFVDLTKFVDCGMGRTYTRAEVRGHFGRMKVDGVKISRYKRSDCSIIHFVGKDVVEFHDSHMLSKAATSSDVEVWADLVRAELNGGYLE